MIFANIIPFSSDCFPVKYFTDTSLSMKAPQGSRAGEGRQLELRAGH